MIDVDYSTFKNFVSTRKLEGQYITLASGYMLIAKDGFLELSSTIKSELDIQDFESSHKSSYNKKIGESSLPFASKKVDGKSLFKRIHGIQQNCVVGSNTISFAIPYPQVKITGVEFVWGSKGDNASLEVYDTATGTYTGVPNYKLNQFGFTVNIAENLYEHKSEYDADLYYGMIIKITYVANIEGIIGVNLILNELK